MSGLKNETAARAEMHSALIGESGVNGRLVKFLKVVAIAWQKMYNISAIAWKGVDNMAATTNFSVRMNSEIKEQCEAL